VSTGQVSKTPLAYLDHASTTPLRPGVDEAMAPFAYDRFANASGSHRASRSSRQALEDARDQVASSLGADPAEVVFTGGGTEADNLAVLGAARARAGRRAAPVVVCSAFEHAAVKEPCRALAKGVFGTGFELREIPVDRQGVVELDGLVELLDDDVVVVSVMLANNEVGTVQPLAAVAELVRQGAPNAALHCDAIQAVPSVDVSSVTALVDLLSVSAHKLGGPKGSGALVVRRGLDLVPLVFGGGQERERRSGTHDVGAAVGFATALASLDVERQNDTARIKNLRDALAEGLVAIDGVRETVDRRSVLPGHCHLLFDGCEQEELLVLLDDGGVCASGGAACASGALEPSPALLAMGLGAKEAASAVRFSLGHTTTARDISLALDVVPAAVAALRGG
jgi:cysteine desulfurase